MKGFLCDLLPSHIKGIVHICVWWIWAENSRFDNCDIAINWSIWPWWMMETRQHKARLLHFLDILRRHPSGGADHEWGLWERLEGRKRSLTVSHRALIERRSWHWIRDVSRGWGRKKLLHQLWKKNFFAKVLHGTVLNIEDWMMACTSGFKLIYLSLL